MEKSECSERTNTRATKAGNSRIREREPEPAKSFVKISIYSDEPDKDAPPQKVPEPATGFNRLETKHHQRHVKEMGFKNTKEYEKAAVTFFNSDKGKLYYSEKWGKFYRYDEKAQLLAISSKGVIHTFWKRTQKEFERIRRQDQLNGI